MCQDRLYYNSHVKLTVLSGDCALRTQCKVTLTACEVPWLLAAVADTDLIASVVPPETERVIVAENWLPTVWEAAVWYQLEKVDFTSVLSDVPSTLEPDAGVI